MKKNWSFSDKKLSDLITRSNQMPHTGQITKIRPYTIAPIYELPFNISTMVNNRFSMLNFVLIARLTDSYMVNQLELLDSNDDIKQASSSLIRKETKTLMYRGKMKKR